MKRIGEILVDANAITEKARDQVLVFMKENGVTFGTATLEIGVLPEALLVRALSVQTSSPPACPGDLASIPPEIIQLVPGDLATKYSVIPFRKVGRTLHLAMTRPWDNRAAADIEFRTGLSVSRYVAVTARIVVALEKYYGVLASLRHRSLVARLDRSLRMTSRGTPTIPSSLNRPLENFSNGTNPFGSLQERLSEEAPNPWDTV
jgi:type IV pilus assembly protein PilB